MPKPVSQIEIRDILSLLWRRKWLVIIPIPLVAALTFAGSYLITPEFESSTIIQIDPQIQLIGDLQRLIGQPTGAGAIRPSDRGNMLRSMYNEITSSNFARMLNDRLNLVRSPEIEMQAQTYIQIQPSLTIEVARIQVLQESLRERVDVSWASGDQIEISVNSPHAREARDIANSLGDIFVAEKLRHDLNQIRSSQDFSDVQLEKYDRQVEEKMAEVTGVEQTLARLRNSGATTSEANRSEIEGEINQVDTEIADLRQDERDLLARLNDVDGLDTRELEIDDSETLRTTSDQLLRRLRQIGDLLSRYIWSDPQVINFKLRQNDLLAAIEDENRSLVNQKFSGFSDATRSQLTSVFNTRSRLSYLYNKKPYLASALSDLTPSTDLIPQYEAELTQLQTELRVATDIRDQFRRQIESSTISQALVEDRSASSYRKVEPAKLALEPFKPDRRKILMLGLMLGLAIGGAAVLLIELMDNSFKKVEDVEDFLGLPVIGINPRIEFDKHIQRR